MAEFVITHESLEGFEGSTDTNGKTILMDLAGNKVTLSVRQAKALRQVVSTLIRKNEGVKKERAIVLKERKPKASA